MCLDPHLNLGWGWRRQTGLSPQVKYFTDRSKAVLLLWIFYVFVLSCVCFVFLCVCLCVLCGHLLGKGWPLGSRLWCPLWVCHFTIGIQGQVWSGVVLDCIDSWSLHPYLPCLTLKTLQHSLLYSSCLTPSNRSSSFFTLLFLVCRILSNRSATFLAILILPFLTLSNRSASFLTLLFLSCFTLNNRFASFFTLLILSCLTLGNMSALFLTFLFLSYS